MDFSIATILSLLSPDKLVSGKQIEKKLGCEDEKDIEKLQIALDVLERIGVIAKEFGKYRRCIEKDVVEAKLRCSSKGFCFAIQDDEDADDIYIRETHLSNAWNGDRVLVKIIKEGTRRRSPEGEVKVILERANPSVLARVSQDENGEYVAVPLDDRLLFEIKLRENGIPLAETVDHLAHVGILRYPIGQKPPIGKVLRVLGSDASTIADIDIVCSKHDLPHDFPEKVLAQAETISCETIPPVEWEKRLDLRHLLTIAIEPDVATERELLVENALSLEKTEDGKWILGVHIADVAHFVPEDTPLDREARKRGTAVHLGHFLIPLLPEKVLRCASLTPGLDRLAISVLITLDNRGEVTEYQIKPSIVRVDHQLTYKQVQTMIATNSAKEGLEEPLTMLNHLLFDISPAVRAKRLQKGGFDISLDCGDIAESPPYFKDEGRIGTIAFYPSLPILSLFTELMVLVGQLVAEHLQQLQVPAIYCSQGKPDWDELEDLLKLVANLGLSFQLEQEDEVYPMDYYRLTLAFSNSEHEKVLHHLLLNSLKSNKYTLHPAPHFGLAYDIYTHCLSPGQRYVDLINQRILKKVFEQGRDRRTSRVKEGVDLTSSTCHGQIHWNVLPPEIHSELEADLHSIISHLNEREKIAEDAERDLVGLSKAEKMKDCTGKVFRGLITGVQSYGFFVQILEEEGRFLEEPLLVEGLVHVSSLKDDWYEYVPKYSCLVGRRNRVVYRLGDEVEVEVKSVDYYRQQIDLVVVRGGTVVSENELET